MGDFLHWHAIGDVIGSVCVVVDLQSLSWLCSKITTITFANDTSSLNATRLFILCTCELSSANISQTTSKSHKLLYVYIHTYMVDSALFARAQVSMSSLCSP